MSALQFWVVYLLVGALIVADLWRRDKAGELDEMVRFSNLSTMLVISALLATIWPVMVAWSVGSRLLEWWGRK